MNLIIGQFNDSYKPIMDGVANTVQNYAYYLNHLGKCCVVTPKYPHYVDQDDFEVIRYHSFRAPFRPPYRIGVSSLDFHTKKLLSSINFDIIHVHSPFSSGHLALQIARKKNIPIIATFHSKFYDDFKQALKSDTLAKMAVKYVVHFYEQVDVVWTVNKTTSKTLRDYGYKGPIEIMENGTDMVCNIDLIDNIHYMKHHYRIDENEYVFLFVGQHIWQKNIKMIVEALDIIKQKGIKFTMFFIGEGYAEKELKLYVHRLNLQNQIHFLGKMTDRELLKRFFARSNLFLFPSIYDNAPIVVREAAALKTPSVVVKDSNASEGIVDFVNGFTCGNSKYDLANKIIQAISDKNQLMEIGEKASQQIAKSWEDITHHVANRYFDIIKGIHN